MNVNRRFFWGTPPVLLLFLMLTVGAVQGQDPADSLHVTSQRLEVLDAQGLALFTGDVVARRGDTTLYAETMRVYYDQQTRKLLKIEAVQDVRVIQGDRVATSQAATYETRDASILLTGGARVNQGDNFVEGEQIVLYLDQNRSVVEGPSGGRVNAVFQSAPESSP